MSTSWWLYAFKNNRENYPRKSGFWTKEKGTRVKFNPGLSANRPSNNWALAAQISPTRKCKSGLLLKDRCKNLYASLFHTIFCFIWAQTKSWSKEPLTKLESGGYRTSSLFEQANCAKGLFNGMNKGVKASAVQIFDDITLIIQGEMIVPSWFKK